MTEGFNISSPVSKVKTKGNIEIVGGIVLITAGFFGICSKILDLFIYIDWYVRWGFMEWFGMMFVFLCSAVLGIILVVLGIKNNSIVKQYYEYSKYLAADPNKYISIIAVSANESVGTTVVKLSKMIELGFFPNMYIDTVQNRVRYYGEDLNVGAASAVQGAASNSFIEIKCKECGAVNQIPKGGSGVCEYCGSTLTAEINK